MTEKLKEEEEAKKQARDEEGRKEVTRNSVHSVKPHTLCGVGASTFAQYVSILFLERKSICHCVTSSRRVRLLIHVIIIILAK